MRIDGEWYECDDGVVRPVLRCEVLSANQSWQNMPFLIDTGADRTVFRAEVVAQLGLKQSSARGQLGGVGGNVESVAVTTQFRMLRDDGGFATFRGVFAAFTRPETLDMSVLGRDLLDLFTLVVDREGNVLSLLRDRHRYFITGT